MDPVEVKMCGTNYVVSSGITEMVSLWFFTSGDGGSESGDRDGEFDEEDGTRVHNC
jgi:hypothetical protein